MLRLSYLLIFTFIIDKVKIERVNRTIQKNFFNFWESSDENERWKLSYLLIRNTSKNKANETSDKSKISTKAILE